MLSAVLVDLTKVGSDAFLQAASSMSYINGASKNGYTTVRYSALELNDMDTHTHLELVH